MSAIPAIPVRRRFSHVAAVMGDPNASASAQRNETLILNDPIRMLEWDDRSHFKVLTQMYGSVWPRVLPFCIANMLLTVAVFSCKHYIPNHKIMDMTCNPSGHKYMATMMSFLVVKRVQICYDDYMTCSRQLHQLFQQCRDLVQLVCLLTASDRQLPAQQWRHNVAYDTLLLLRTSMAVLEYPAHYPDREPWNCPELPMDIRAELRQTLFVPRFLMKKKKKKNGDDDNSIIFNNNDWDDDVEAANQRRGRQQSAIFNNNNNNIDEENNNSNNIGIESSHNNNKYYNNSNNEPTVLREDDGEAHSLAQVPLSERRDLDEACRVPLQMAYRLRNTILSQRRNVSNDNNNNDGSALRKGTFRHPCNEELKLIDHVHAFLEAFDRLKICITTPLPFPLVQMTKTALFVWLFTLPFALCHDSGRDEIVMIIVMVVLITFGFLGLEFVAMELSDCFGDDPCDFDNLCHAQMCFEDIYVCLYRVDGPEWAQRLRDKLVPQQPRQSHIMAADAAEAARRVVLEEDQDD